MILEIGKRTVVRGLFRSLLKGGPSSQRHNSVFFTPRVVVGGCNSCFKFPGVLQKKTVGNHLTTFKCFGSEKSEEALDRLTFDSICTETLDSLTEYFEELVESSPNLKNADVTYSDGVLTVNLGSNYGTYVINRQTPNLQIWLSSPTSGPKRYNFIAGTWVYTHDKTTLHSLLDKEITEIVNQPVQFVEKCLHAKDSI